MASNFVWRYNQIDRKRTPILQSSKIERRRVHRGLDQRVAEQSNVLLNGP